MHNPYRIMHLKVDEHKTSVSIIREGDEIEKNISNGLASLKEKFNSQIMKLLSTF